MNALKDIRFKQLNSETALSDRALEQISELVFQTDFYISQAMFQTREDALKIIPELIRRRDAMFRPDNLFVAEHNGDIYGVILWKKGGLNWSPELFCSVAAELNVPLTPWIGQVFSDYFEEYNRTPDHVTEIIDVCVRKELRGCGVGTAMMGAFLAQADRTLPIDLYVLADNTAAMRLYTGFGFETQATVNGFSSDHRQLPCFQMRKSF